MSQASTSSQYLTKPRRSSRSNSVSSAEEQNGGPEKPYTPVLQPQGYRYQIALPSRPQPGQTPWPSKIPPVVLGEASNQPRPRSRQVSLTGSQTHARNSSASSDTSTHSASLSLSGPRSRTNSITPPSAPQQQQQQHAPAAAAPVPPAQQPWTYGLNPLLSPGGGMLWTLRAPVSYIKIRATSLSTPGPLTYSHRSLPTLASRTSLAVTVPLPGQAVRVQAETLGALLEAVSDALQGQASQTQWAAADQRLAALAYRARCGIDQVELAKGIKRVDLLGPNAAFAGIHPTLLANGTYEWVLRVVASA